MREKKIIKGELYLTCSKCNKLLHHNEFTNRSDSEYNKNSMCKNCYNEYMRHYTKNYQGNYTRNKRIDIITKLGNKCEDCGCDFEPYLEIHHKNHDGNKERALYGSWRTVINKISKLPLNELKNKYSIKCCVCHSKYHIELKYNIYGFTVIWNVPQ